MKAGNFFQNLTTFPEEALCPFHIQFSLYGYASGFLKD